MKKNNEMVSYKSNDLIQNYAWDLKQFEIDVFEFLCCCYNTEYYNSEKNIIKFSLKDFAKECNESVILDGGIYYKKIKSALKKISDQSLWVLNENNDEELLRMISKPIIKKNHSDIICIMSDDYKKHMEKHKNGNAFLELKILRTMPSKYSKNLYNIIRAWNGKDKLILSIDYLKRKLKMPESYYENVGKIKQVFTKAVDEYNNIIQHFYGSQSLVSYKFIKKGRKFSSVVISLQHKVSEEDVLDLICFEKNPLEMNFENDEAKEQYIEEWINYHYGIYDNNKYEKYYSLYNIIPEDVHMYDEKRVDAIYDIAREFINLIEEQQYVDNILKAEFLIGRFNARKWFHNYENKVKKDVYAYYVKSFELWCIQQRKYNAMYK